MAGMNIAAMVAPHTLWMPKRERAWEGNTEIGERVGTRGFPPNALSFSWGPYEWVSK